MFVYFGALLTAAWGVAHLFPTGNVVRGFGDISPDNRRILGMEWILEGVSLIFIGALVATVTYVDASSAVSKTVYALSITGLIVFAVVSAFTGFRVAFLPFKLCPFIFGVSAALIFFGGIL